MHSKIYWLHDFRLSEWLGGAQLTTDIMYRNCPFDVEMMYPKQFNRDKLDGHLILISNCGRYRWEDLKWIADTQRYIKYERDIAFCKHRTALDHDCRVECKRELAFYTRLFKNSILNIFLSPLQGRLFFRYMPTLNKEKVYYSPAPIEVSKFAYTGPKQDLYLAVAGSGNEYIKGIDIIKQELRGKNLIVLGSDRKVPYEEMPKWFKRAKYFVAKPRVVEGFCRSVAEAYCASCKLIVNHNVGFTEYKWPFDNRRYVTDKLRNEPEKFWKKIGEYL